MLRIAQLIETDGPGGAERVVAQLARTLAAAGNPTVVFVPQRGEGWLAEELRGSGVAIEGFYLDRPLDPGLAARLAEAFRAHRIQLAHSHEFTMSVYGAWGAWGSSIPHVMTMHGGRYHAGQLRRRIALRAASQASQATVAVSDTVARALRRDLWIPRNQVTVVPNGVAPPRGDGTLRAELGLAPHERLLLAVGNLYAVKGHRYLVEALAWLRGQGFAVHVAIAGRGQEKQPLAEQAHALGVSDQLHLLGLRSDIGNLLSSADLFVLPSLSEGLPLALLEAMLAGCAVVASNVGDVATALDHGTVGRLVPPADSHALAHALGRLLAHPADAHFLGARARQRATTHYTVDRMVERYVALYGKLLSPLEAPFSEKATRSANGAPRASVASASGG
jgi:glycosyltransferase involved in cell wall biosynthesis